jgi:hypothetical protein
LPSVAAMTASAWSAPYDLVNRSMSLALSRS